MRLRTELVLVVIWIVCGTASAAARPNVLFLISDDLNCFQGCYGDERARTPNIDKLASRGVRFDRAYCTYPLCGPSRNSFLTGLYPNSTGILANAQLFRQSIPSQKSLPQCFRLAGYFAARVGKLYHYGVPGSIGTNGHDDPASWEVEANPAGVDRLEELKKAVTLKPGDYGASLSWYASPESDARHTDAMNADDAIWMLQRCAKQKDRPFFLAVGFFRPHTPYISPRDPYFNYYPVQEMPVVENVEQDQADIPPAALTSTQSEHGKLTDELRRQCRQAYYASISFMDAQVGRVVDALDRLGLAEDTIIVFTSDHGYHMGEHGLWQKRSLFEECARVPLVMVVPGVTSKGTVAATPVSHIDLFPTLAELCDVEAPDNVQGQSLVPMLKDPSVAGRGWALTQVTRGGATGKPAAPGKRGRREGAKRSKGGSKQEGLAGSKGSGQRQGRFFGYSLRTNRWRYTEWDEGRQGRELYDHDADPGELTNLADDPGHAATVKELSNKLREAIKLSLPPSGETPAVAGAMWAPNLTNP